MRTKLLQSLMRPERHSERLRRKCFRFVSSRRIVLDANILVRAVLGVKVGSLLNKYAESIDFCAPTVAFADASEHLPAIMEKRGIGTDDLSASIEAVRLLISEVPHGVTDAVRDEALRRIGRRDPDDCNHRGGTCA